MKAKLVPLPLERRERGWINCQKYIIDLTFCSTYRHFSSTCKWYLLSVNKSFVEKYVLKIVNWIYILLGIITSAIFLLRWLLLKHCLPRQNPRQLPTAEVNFEGWSINFDVVAISETTIVKGKTPVNSLNLMNNSHESCPT